MRDILETLKWLPPVCAAEIEGSTYLIRRGARQPDPWAVDVADWNRQHHVLPWQVEAMKRGVHLGWEHALIDEEVGEARFWTVVVPFVMTGVLRAHSEAEIEQLIEEMREGMETDNGQFSISFDGNWELVDGPRETE